MFFTLAVFVPYARSHTGSDYVSLPSFVFCPNFFGFILSRNQ